MGLATSLLEWKQSEIRLGKSLKKVREEILNLPNTLVRDALLEEMGALNASFDQLTASNEALTEKLDKVVRVVYE